MNMLSQSPVQAINVVFTICDERKALYMSQIDKKKSHQKRYHRFKASKDIRERLRIKELQILRFGLLISVLHN